MRTPTSDPAEIVARRLASVRSSPADMAPWEHQPTRIRPVPPQEEEESATVDVPIPGRHARRRGGGRGVRLPPMLGQVGLGPRHVTVLALTVAAALAVACWLIVRSTPESLATAEPEPAPVIATPAGSSGADPTASVTTELIVDVAGKVKRPGIAVLPGGARVVDALEAAGGARRGADLAGLNLARPLVDGEQILVGIAPAPGVAASVVGTATPGSGALVSLNSADLALLDTLPGVGPVTAQAILDWRDTNGGFTSVDELLEVKGIGEATLADLAPLVTL